jgi:hypothetical protein
MSRRQLQIVLLTAFFVGGYFGLRAIPGSSCTFLHYDQVQVTADGVQFCGVGAAPFVDVSRMPFPVAVNLNGDHPPAVGETANYTLTLETLDGKTLRPSELAVTHTQKMHLLVIDPSLQDYQHIHPVPVGDSGEWTFAFAPRLPGTYKVFAEFVPSLTLRQVIGECAIVVPGKPAPGTQRGLQPYADGDYIYNLSLPAGPLKAGSDGTLDFSIKRKDGGAVKLEPVMGALAHLAAFDQERRGYAHLHPAATVSDVDPLRPDLSFAFNTGEAGRYRVWAQVRLDGQERFVPFDVDVAER